MAGKITAHLAARGIELPKPRAPVANYVPAVISGNYVHVAGQICAWNQDVRYVGQLGRELSIEAGQEAARLCALNILAQLDAAIGDLDRVVRCIKINVFVNSSPAFIEQSKVANGASDLLVEIFGDRGRHARSAIGVAQLPFGASVEIDGIFEIA